MGRGGRREGAGRPSVSGNSNNQTPKKGDVVVVFEDDFQEFEAWYEKFQALSPEKRRLYAAKNKLNATLYRMNEEKHVDKDAQRTQTTLYHYYQDVTLFKTKYLKKQAVQWQEECIRKILSLWRQGVSIVIVKAPRRHGKTEGVAQPLLMHHTVFNKNDSAKYLTLAQDLAIQKIQPVKDHFENNWELIKDFGPFKTQQWAKTHFTIERSGYFPDPTIESLGLDTAYTGKNTDFGIVDDPDKVGQSGDVRKKNHDLLMEFLNTLNPNAHVLLIKTVKSEDDISAIYESEDCPYCKSSHKGSAAIITYKAILKGDFRNPGPTTYELVRDDEGNIIDVVIHGDYEVLWPERWDIRKLIMKYFEIGDREFSREYQQEPVGIGGILKESWIKWHEIPDEGIIGTRDYHRFISVDLALSEKETADYSGIVCFGKDTYTNKFYVVKTVAVHKSLHEVALIVRELADWFKPKSIIIEAIGAFAPLTTNWPNVIPYPIDFITKKVVGKEERIASTMQPIMQNEQLYIRRDHADLIFEITHFGNTSKDHLIDALQQGIQTYLEKYGRGVKFRHRELRK